MFYRFLCGVSSGSALANRLRLLHTHIPHGPYPCSKKKTLAHYASPRLSPSKALQDSARRFTDVALGRQGGGRGGVPSKWG